MKPTVQAILLADRVYQDRSGKFIIAGVFNLMGIKRRPNQNAAPSSDSSGDEVQANVTLSALDIQDVGNPWAYISLTNVKGATPLELRFESLTGDVVHFSIRLDVNGDDPLASVQISLPVPRLPKVIGMYVLDLLYEETSIGSHRVQIVEIPNADG